MKLSRWRAAFLSSSSEMSTPAPGPSSFHVLNTVPGTVLGLGPGLVPGAEAGAEEGMERGVGVERGVEREEEEARGVGGGIPPTESMYMR